MIKALQIDFREERKRFIDSLDTDHANEMKYDIRAGLTARPRSIPSKYFYDSIGSALFEEITRTPEYYLTRTELSILESSARNMVQFLAGDGGDIVELGSGPTTKVRKLLDAACERGCGRLRYVPMDICGTCIESVIEELPPLYPGLELLGIKADFTSDLYLLPRGKKLLILFGSTVGNLTDEECLRFLERIRRTMETHDRLLVGFDMLKPVEVLEAAYNDSRGITRQFNLNMLARVNKELKGNFDPADFRHQAFFNPAKERIEMHLLAVRDVSVRISDISVDVELKRGETIRTEISRKFSRDEIERTLFDSGFRIEKWFTDPLEWFSLVQAKIQKPSPVTGKRFG